MSAESRRLKIGDKVSTDFSGRFTVHEITEIKNGWLNSTSGIGFKVKPLVPRSTGDFIDADWFEIQP